MKKNMEGDLVDLADILEVFVDKLDKMSQADLIDLAARLKPVAAHVEVIDKHVKTFVKEKLKHKEGSLLGANFRAELKLVPIDRFEQKEFKEVEPVLYKEYIRKDTDERVSFKVR